MPFAPNTYGILFGGEDGNVHSLNLASLSGTDLSDSTAIWSDGSPIIATWQSKTLDLGSHGILKQIRRIVVEMEGLNVTFQVQYTKMDGTTLTDTFASKQIPLDDDDFFSIANANRIWRSINFYLSGQNIEIRNLGIIWCLKRFSKGS
jgi:hypothetical protein